MHSMNHDNYKCNNLQQNTLGRCVDGTIVSLTKCLMFQVLFFFIISCKILFKNPFNLFSYNFTKIEIKSFELLAWTASNPLFYFQSIKIILWPSDTWLMRQMTQLASVLYWRLLDFCLVSAYTVFSWQRFLCQMSH